MDFLITSTFNDRAVSFWWNHDKLYCTDVQAEAWLYQMAQLHLPEIVVLPDVMDYDGDLTEGRMAYNAILDIFPNHQIIKEPSNEFITGGPDGWGNSSEDVVY